MQKRVKDAINTIKANLSQFIHNERNNKDISIRELSRISGVSTAVISDLENSKSLPSLEIIVKLGFALDIELGSLIYAFLHTESNKLCKDNYISDDSAELKRLLNKRGLDNKQYIEVIKFIEFQKFTGTVITASKYK